MLLINIIITAIIYAIKFSTIICKYGIGLLGSFFARQISILASKSTIKRIQNTSGTINLNKKSGRIYLIHTYKIITQHILTSIGIIPFIRFNCTLLLMLSKYTNL